MSDFGDWLAKGVVNVYEVQKDDEEIDDILDDLEPEATVVMCRDAKPIDYDHIFPFGPDFVHAEVYSYSMQEYCEWIGKAASLIEDMYEMFKQHGMGIYLMDDPEHDTLPDRLRDFGIEVSE